MRLDLIDNPSLELFFNSTWSKPMATKPTLTEAFLRFSTVAGERGAAAPERDVRGFALRYYTEEGNWDIVGNNTPNS